MQDAAASTFIYQLRCDAITAVHNHICDGYICQIRGGPCEGLDDETRISPCLQYYENRHGKDVTIPYI